MKNQSFITLEGITSNTSDGPERNLMNAIIERAINDLLCCMLQENRQTNSAVILKTPIMQDCNDIPTYPRDDKKRGIKKGDIKPGKYYEFSENYKEEIIRKYKAFRKEFE